MSTKVEIGENGVTLTREFAASRERVFEAWTKPELIQRWWGCAETSKVVSTVDLRVGGAYNHLMTMSHGEYQAEGTITELDPPAKLAFSQIMAPPGAEPVTTTVTAVFEALGEDRCRLTMTHEGISDGFICDQVSKGWGAGMDKLGAVVEG